MQNVLPHGQLFATLLTAAFFLLMLRVLTPERRLIVLCFLAVATVGECLFSLVFGVYEYRLRNIPIYVPLCHPMLLVFAWALAELPLLQRHHAVLTKSMGYMHVFALLFVLVVWGDTLSLAFALLGVYIFRRRRFNLIYGFGLYRAGARIAWHALRLLGMGGEQCGRLVTQHQSPYGAFLGYVAADVASIKMARWISAQWFPKLQIVAP